MPLRRTHWAGCTARGRPWRPALPTAAARAASAQVSLLFRTATTHLQVSCTVYRYCTIPVQPERDFRDGWLPSGPLLCRSVFFSELRQCTCWVSCTVYCTVPVQPERDFRDGWWPSGLLLRRSVFFSVLPQCSYWVSCSVPVQLERDFRDD
jgi:hypothetical protein